ncbi:MAG TPA: hypothetical protein VK928_00970, partial [Longimicrobiales bacterium]|nr:hypothetical protein [Longimicrobiales bacterium]
MSNALRYDSLLVRDLAAELDRTLAGARLDAAFLDRERLRVTLRTRAARRGDAEPPSLLWDLHPTSGHLITTVADGDAGGRVQLGTQCFVRAVSTLPDERVIVLDLHSDGAHAGAARRIVVELITNQWNAVA